ncbi:hypothetical protein AVEN_125136-1 [Araneus ventricosus]|uniref:Uncharacterized protein n=1 Tax=Araneus ventricosus TaxID=182803 RepID=A0A4Y2RV97_ARAVE|nr:hypothetical protein AVEN_125136-1 [Araneus ventricosus]
MSCPLHHLSSTASTSFFEGNLVTYKFLGTQIGCRIWAIRGWLQTSHLIFRSNSRVLRAVLSIVMQEDDTITQHARAFASDNFKIDKRLFPFPEIEGLVSVQPV